MTSWVYFLRRADGLIKIGRSIDPRVRARTVATIVKQNVTLIGAEPGDYDLERRRHADFGPAWREGEWFGASPELVAHIAAVGLPAAALRRNEPQRHERQLNFRVSVDLRRAVQLRARAGHRTVGEHVRMVLEAHVADTKV